MQFLKISIHFLSVYLFLRTTFVSRLSTNLPIIKTDEDNFLKVQKQGHEGQKISGYLAPSVTFSLAVTCHICARCDQTVIFKQVEKNSFKQVSLQWFRAIRFSQSCPMESQHGLVLRVIISQTIRSTTNVWMNCHCVTIGSVAQSDLTQNDHEPRC